MGMARDRERERERTKTLDKLCHCVCVWEIVIRIEITTPSDRDESSHGVAPHSKSLIALCVQSSFECKRPLY